MYVYTQPDWRDAAVLEASRTPLGALLGAFWGRLQPPGAIPARSWELVAPIAPRGAAFGATSPVPQ
eukprot:4527394-Pyramimonas_sp.AAC.1